MKPEYFSLLTAVVSLIAVCITVAGFFVTHYLTRQRSDREYKLKKLEDVFLIVEKLKDTLFAEQDICEFEADGGGAVEIEKRKAALAKVDEDELRDKLIMLTSIYLTSLKPGVSAFLSAGVNLRIAIVHCDFTGSTSKKLIDVESTGEKLHKEYLHLRLAIIKCADKLSRGSAAILLSYFKLKCREFRDWLQIDGRH